MKAKYLSGVACAALATALGFGGAQAQSPNWTGAYFGGYGGWAGARSYATTTVDCSQSPFDFTAYFCDSGTPDNGLAVSATGTGGMSADTFIYGLQAGYNVQSARWVYGFETDFGSFHLNGSRTGTGVYPTSYDFVSAGDGYSVNTGFSTTWLFTARGRFGWATDNVFRDHDSLWIYGTGGLAVTDLHVSFNFSDVDGGTGSGSASRTLAGYALGFGLEYMIDSNWSVKAEYLHLGFGHVCASGIIDSGIGYSQGIDVCADLKADLARIGINYKL
jgi:outer membrane immunogenic protein